MFTQKQPHSVDSTTVRPEEEECLQSSPQKWKQLQAKYLKYIALLKSKADKSKKKVDQNNKYIQLALSLKYKIQNKMLSAFKKIEFNKYRDSEGNNTCQEGANNTSVLKISALKQLASRVQVRFNQHLQSAFLSFKSYSNRSNSRAQHSPSKQLPKNPKHLRAIQSLKKLQSSILTFSDPTDFNQAFELRSANITLKQQIIVKSQEILKLKQQLELSNQRMETELLKKSLALMESEIDGQEKQQLIKQYEIQLQCRTSNNNKVLLFTLEDFEIERRRLEIINEKLFKEFENTKETFVEEIKNQNAIINDLKARLYKVNITLTTNNIELESLKAYKFENQYQKQCERYKGTEFRSSPKLSMKNSPVASELLEHIETILSKQKPNKSVFLHLNQKQVSKLQQIQQKLQSLINPPNVINKIIRLNSLEKSVFQQNVKASNQDLNSFLDVFQQQHLSIDSRIHQQLQNKVLSLNERLFNIRELILTLLQSIQIRNPPKELLNLIQNIYDVFQFSEPEKESFYGGRKSIFQRIFS